MQKTIILDANAILRYLLCDIKEQADEVEAILYTSAIMVLPEVAAEVIYTLTKHYKLPLENVVDIVLSFLDTFYKENNILHNATSTFAEGRLDFVDCLLYEYSKLPFYEVVTFDKRLKKKIAEGTIL